MTKAKPCADCGERAKRLPRHFCEWCQLKRRPMHEQVEEARARLEAVPEKFRLKRSQKLIKDDTPEGMGFCAGCQSFCPIWYFGKGATQCRACTSAKNHAARTERVYGINSEEYERILSVQDGKCAICRNKPQTERLAVDHDHKTGQVRGLLNSRCNHELLGSAHDEPRALWNAFLYLLAPPAALRSPGAWERFLNNHPMPSMNEVKQLANLVPKEPTSWSPGDGPMNPFSIPGRDKGWAPSDNKEFAHDETACSKGAHFLPSGSESVPGKKGMWRYWFSTDPDTDAPF